MRNDYTKFYYNMVLGKTSMFLSYRNITDSNAHKSNNHVFESVYTSKCKMLLNFIPPHLKPGFPSPEVHRGQSLLIRQVILLPGFVLSFSRSTPVVPAVALSTNNRFKSDQTRFCPSLRPELQCDGGAKLSLFRIHILVRSIIKSNQTFIHF